MRPWTQWVLVAVVGALLASPALAQRRPGGFGMPGIFLLNQKSVQEELKLTEEQVKKTAEAGEKLGAAFQELRDLQGEERTKKRQELAKEGEKTVASILTKDQAKRFKEIGFQVQGAFAFANPVVVKALMITDDQKAEIRKLQEQAGKDLQKIREESGDNGEAARRSSREYLKGVTAKATKLLTDEQKTKWKEMTGKPFTGEIRFGPPPRR